MKTHTTSLKAKINSAFSLVELLVVIAVIAVIAAIAIPNITGAREAAVAAQESYNTNAFNNMANQVEALTGTRPSLADLQSATGVTHTITNADGTTKDVTFKLQ
jgi:prepilin-type N-terminal cleavage/methylation domain-containing protein